MPFVFGWRAIRLGLKVGVVVHRLRPNDALRELDAAGPRLPENRGQAG